MLPTKFYSTLNMKQTDYKWERKKKAWIMPQEALAICGAVFRNFLLGCYGTVPFVKLFYVSEND